MGSGGDGVPCYEGKNKKNTTGGKWVQLGKVPMPFKHYQQQHFTNFDGLTNPLIIGKFRFLSEELEQDLMLCMFKKKKKSTKLPGDTSTL